MKIENENIEQPQNPQLNIGAVMRSAKDFKIGHFKIGGVSRYIYQR